MILASLALGALAGILAVYAYAVAALAAHGRLATLAPPRSLAGALARGAWMPACGCTALAHARRLAAPHRAPFLVAAYAASPLLAAAAWLLAGALAALAVVALALAAAALAARLVPEGAAPPRARLDDLLLRRDAAPLRDALPYLGTFAVPALTAGALVGAASAVAPPLARGVAWGALALVLAAPRADIAADHGAPFARRVFALHAIVALVGGVTVGVLAVGAPAWRWA